MAEVTTLKFQAVSEADRALVHDLETMAKAITIGKLLVAHLADSENDCWCKYDATRHEVWRSRQDTGNWRETLADQVAEQLATVYAELEGRAIKRLTEIVAETVRAIDPQLLEATNLMGVEAWYLEENDQPYLRDMLRSGTSEEAERQILKELNRNPTYLRLYQAARGCALAAGGTWEDIEMLHQDYEEYWARLSRLNVKAVLHP